ncbi:MAG: DUF4388 domain-containing protein [Anaerolineae bacterium]|nr:DUF4388 domain-containing protein [Anaerolineae bacterium]
MALKGNLRDFSTTQLLNLIALARKTGVLTIHGAEPARMSFREGKLIHATVGNQEGSLSQILQHAGKLTVEQSAAIQSRAADKSDKQLGHMLIQANYVTQGDIIQSVRQYVLDVVYKLFTWADGTFQFEANKLPPPERITIPIDLEGVIMEGSRRLKEWERLQEEIPDLDIALKFTDKPTARLRNINLTVEEWRVISFINPRNSIRQIAQGNNLNDFEVRRIVYGLIQAGIVEPVMVKKPKQVLPPTQTTRRGVPIETPDQSPEEKRSIVSRLITRIKGL